MDSFATAGERLCGRHFEKEMRAGAQHYKPGQMSARLIGDEEAIFVFVSWINHMGHAVCMPVIRKPEGEWETLGVYREAAQKAVYPPRNLDDDYSIPENTVRFLKEAEESWQRNAN
jgi:hypothetical protein